MHGLLLIDKAPGVTSHDVVRQVRRICKTRKVGHAGTLDPLATGVLPVAVGDGTKVLQFLLAEDKSYRATFKLGEVTDTLDADGQVLETRAVSGIGSTELAVVCAGFVGMSSQVPPMYSALKRNGVPLYKLARQGEEVAREARTIRIDRLELVAVDLPNVTIEVDCSKGTYIRSLVADIGERLGCGAHLTALRRLRSGPFSIENCCRLEDLQKSGPGGSLLTLEQALEQYPVATVTAGALEKLRCGVPPETTQVDFDRNLEAGELVRLQASERLIAMARYAPHRAIEKRGDFELVRVFGAQ